MTGGHVEGSCQPKQSSCKAFNVAVNTCLVRCKGL